MTTSHAHRTLITDKEAKATQIVDAESQLSEAISNVGSLVDAYTTRALHLSLLPASGMNAHGEDLSCRLMVASPHDDVERVLSVDMDDVVRPALTRFKVRDSHSPLRCVGQGADIPPSPLAPPSRPWSHATSADVQSSLTAKVHTLQDDLLRVQDTVDKSDQSKQVSYLPRGRVWPGPPGGVERV